MRELAINAQSSGVEVTGRRAIAVLGNGASGSSNPNVHDFRGGVAAEGKLVQVLVVVAAAGRNPDHTGCLVRIEAGCGITGGHSCGNACVLVEGHEWIGNRQCRGEGGLRAANELLLGGSGGRRTRWEGLP